MGPLYPLFRRRCEIVTTQREICEILSLAILTPVCLAILLSACLIEFYSSAFYKNSRSPHTSLCRRSPSLQHLGSTAIAEISGSVKNSQPTDYREDKRKGSCSPRNRGERNTLTFFRGFESVGRNRFWRGLSGIGRSEEKELLKLDL